MGLERDLSFHHLAASSLQALVITPEQWFIRHRYIIYRN
jgi:hypothetical protein